MPSGRGDGSATTSYSASGHRSSVTVSVSAVERCRSRRTMPQRRRRVPRRFGRSCSAGWSPSPSPTSGMPSALRRPGLRAPAPRHSSGARPGVSMHRADCPVTGPSAGGTAVDRRRHGRGAAGVAGAGTRRRATGWASRRLRGAARRRAAGRPGAGRTAVVIPLGRLSCSGAFPWPTRAGTRSRWGRRRPRTATGRSAPSPPGTAHADARAGAHGGRARPSASGGL